MKIFRDPEYERMMKEEWLSVATEKTKFSLFDRLESIIQPVVVPDEIVRSMIKIRRELRINLSKEATALVRQHYQITSDLEWTLIRQVGAFTILADQTIDLRLPIRVSISVDLSTLQKTDLLHHIRILAYLELRHLSVKTKPLNTLLNILLPSGFKLPKKPKHMTQFAYKRAYVVTTLENILMKNTFNIKSIDLMLKLISWVKDYMLYESPYALLMISKLKAMTHAKNPIYSVEGE